MFQALVDCFVEFDRTIIKRDVVAQLKRIAGKATDDHIEDEEEVGNLYEEATMPLEEVIAKYEAKENSAEVQHTVETEKEVGAEGDGTSSTKFKTLKNPALSALAAGSSKPISPFLRAKDKKIPSKDQNEDTSCIAKEIDFKNVESVPEKSNGEVLTDQKDHSKAASKIDKPTDTIGTCDDRESPDTKFQEDIEKEVEVDSVSNGNIDTTNTANQTAIKSASEINGHHNEKTVRKKLGRGMCSRPPS